MLYPKSQRVSVVRSDDEIRVSWRWKKDLGRMFFGLSCLYMALGLLTLFAPSPKQQENATQVIEWFLLPVLATILTFSICWLRNKTTVTVTKDSVTVLSRPMGRLRAITFPAEGIQQFFVFQGVTGRYAILYIMHADSTAQVIGQMFDDAASAHQVCHELQDWFGLEDLPVYGHNTQSDQLGPRKP